MADADSGAGAIAHITEPIADGGENLTISGNGEVGLLEALWSVTEITKGLTRLIFARTKHTHPKIDGGVLFIMVEQTIGNGHPTSISTSARI
jgi:hypothetical protein